MNTRRWLTGIAIPALVATLTLTLAACGNGGATEGDGPAVDAGTPDASAATTAPAEGEMPAGGETEASPVPLIASGTVEAVPTSAAPIAQPTTEGKRRTVALSEAVAAIPFKLLEPAALPEGTYPPSSVHLVEANEGQETDALPAVRFIYDIDGGGTLVLLQSPARGVDIPGAETLDVGGKTVYKTETGDQIILTWEQDGVNLELRSNGVKIEDLTAIVGGMGPLGSGPTSKEMGG